MSYTLFPENFSAAEEIRYKVIYDILFSPNPPSIEDVFECIPRPSTRRDAKTWTNNLMSWDTWSIGTLTKAYEFRNGEIKNGWGSQGSHQRIVMENQIYETTKKQAEEIEEQKKQIKELTSMMDTILVKNPRLKDEWVDIEENVNMI